MKQRDDEFTNDDVESRGVNFHDRMKPLQVKPYGGNIITEEGIEGYEQRKIAYNLLTDPRSESEKSYKQQGRRLSPSVREYKVETEHQSDKDRRQRQQVESDQSTNKHGRRGYVNVDVDSQRLRPIKTNSFEIHYRDSEERYRNASPVARVNRTGIPVINQRNVDEFSRFDKCRPRNDGVDLSNCSFNSNRNRRTQEESGFLCGEDYRRCYREPPQGRVRFITNENDKIRQPVRSDYVRFRQSLNGKEESESDDEYAVLSRQRGNQKQNPNRNRKWITPEHFDGLTPLATFLGQFETCAQYNRWDDDDKLAHLRISLRGSAALLLSADGAHCSTFEELVDKLKRRYGTEGQVALYRTQLRTRRRGRDESLQSLYLDISRLTALAYPGRPTEHGDAIAVDSFIDALEDDNLELRVRDREPKDLDEAYRTALMLEANSRGRRIRNKEESPE